MDGTRLWSLGESTVALYDLGRWDEVIAAADEVDHEAKARSWTQITGFADPMHARILFYRGDLAGAAAISTDNLSAARAAGDPQLVIPALELEGLIAVAKGRADEARTMLLEVLRITAETGPLVVSVAPELIRIACATGDIALARRLLDASVARPGRTGIIFVTGRAVIAEAEGRVEEALADFRDAADRWKVYGSVPERGFALIGQGRCLIKLGRAAEADEPLRAARELFASLGAARPLAEIDDLPAQTTARAG
jgi:ATP/maltotriose-dependent transcriptional regulator MalT